MSLDRVLPEPSSCWSQGTLRTPELCHARVREHPGVSGDTAR
jgi:hypothetical protein